METTSQMATVLINVEGTTQPIKLLRAVAGCQSLVIGIHTLAGIPANANFRTQVGWPGLGSAGLVMRPLGNEFSSNVVMPPVTVLR
jgi:hypothetical protein